MTNTYTLVIKFLGEIEFKCSLSHDLKYMRVLQDDAEYKKMVDEIIKEGRIIVRDAPDIDGSENVERYKTEVIKVNTPEKLTEVLEADFECELIHDLVSQFTIYADGEDFGFEDAVMAQSSKYGINALSTLLFNAANDSDYEPQRLELAGSYGLNILDAVENKEAVERVAIFLKEIKEGQFNQPLYKEGGAYAKFINALEELPTTVRLDSLTFDVKDETILLTLNDIERLKHAKKKMYELQRLNYRTDSATAIKVDTRKFQIKDSEGHVIFCTAKSIDMIKDIKKHEGQVIHYIGRSAGPKSVNIENISIFPIQDNT